MYVTINLQFGALGLEEGGGAFVMSYFGASTGRRGGNSKRENFNLLMLNFDLISLYLIS